MFPISDSVPRLSFPVLTIGLILLNSYIFYLELQLPVEQIEQYIYEFGLTPRLAWYRIELMKRGQLDLLTLITPFVTSIFLHGSLLHLISNMWSLWIFGDNAEDLYGHVGFLFFYIFCGVAASILHIYVYPNSGTPVVGASGAIAGIMGTYLVNYPWGRIIVFIPLIIWPLIFKIPAVFFILIWFYSQVAYGLGSIANNDFNIAWWAHIGGFITGAMLGLVRRNRPKNRY
jgi:membrane associated rhomboid family serine protease